MLVGCVVAARSLESLESILKNLHNGSGSLERADDDNDMERMLDKVIVSPLRAWRLTNG